MKNNKKKNGRGRKANKLNSRIVFFSFLFFSLTSPTPILTLLLDPLLIFFFSFSFSLFTNTATNLFFLLLQPKRCYSPVPGFLMMMMIATVCWKTFMCCCQDCSRHLETPCVAGVLRPSALNFLGIRNSRSSHGFKKKPLLFYVARPRYTFVFL